MSLKLLGAGSMEINVNLVGITVLGVTLEVIPPITYYSKETALERVKDIIPYSTTRTLRDALVKYVMISYIGLGGR